eukprot:891806-Amphidinium_carterae.1
MNCDEQTLAAVTISFVTALMLTNHMGRRLCGYLPMLFQGELGMIIPAHPDESVRGKTDAPTLNALYCLSEGKAIPKLQAHIAGTP